ncbi:hypothetical protein FHR24_002068 [Wenyingzhuangia heitensis]|uniref:Uncharacterized protein n=1 Tax=Wenyingzhuangia heitensis TaxID=1487859 RepID=A0ABX0U9U8_9FLAO|nr:hypothetical protein [Wenyingzhuangia heitensis]NIJ45600.1 hypothetical protein [Wenyingzhuangia heitensis]
MKNKIPLWINILQGVLILIMLSQVYQFYFDHNAVTASGININGVADYNLIYEFAARTATMAIVSIFIMFSQDVKLFVAMFLMNVLREGQETIIDPLFPLLNAPASPTMDLVIHIIIVGVELIAFVKLYKISKIQVS